jgi:hypothetical protein
MRSRGLLSRSRAQIPAQRGHGAPDSRDLGQAALAVTFNEVFEAGIPALRDIPLSRLLYFPSASAGFSQGTYASRHRMSEVAVVPIWRPDVILSRGDGRCAPLGGPLRALGRRTGLRDSIPPVPLHALAAAAHHLRPAWRDSA